jgi:hypothetical protein
MRKFGLIYGDYPGIFGMDIIGELLSCEGATRFKVGDPV